MATSNRFNFDQVKQNLERTKRELPVRLAKQAENYFTASFTKQGFDGKKWKEVNRRIPGTYEYKYPKSKGLTRRTKPILIGSGALRRAVSNSIRNATFELVELQVDLPYAQIHNQGGTINIGAHKKVIHFNGKKFSKISKATHAQKVDVGAYSVVMPKRTFMKQTNELTVMQDKTIKTAIDRIWA